MRILIGEDEVVTAKCLKCVVESFGYEVVGIGHNKENVIRMIDKYIPDMLLQDINMDESSDGIHVGRYVLENYSFPHIYVTAHSDIHIVKKALETKPVGYIIKPFSAKCGIASLVLSQTTFSCSNIGANTVTLTATDVNGNVNSATAVVTVVDNLAPTSGGTKILTIPSGGQTNGWSPWYSYFSDPLPAGAILTGIDLTYTAVDQGWGGSGAPSDMSVSGTYIGSGVLGHSSSTNTINFTGLFSTYIYGGTNNLQMNFWGYPGWQAFWQGGTVTFHYQQAGGGDCLSITKQLDASGHVTITSDEVNPGFTDACGIASITLSKYSFDCSNVGANHVNLVATDNNGNASNCTALVTIEDPILPIAIAQDIIVQLDASGSASITATQINNGSTDACGIATLTLDKSTFDCSNVGANTVILTVTDTHGNVSAATAIVTVQDKIAPGLTVPANIVHLNDARVCGALVNIGLAVATDNCTVVSVTSNAPAFFPVGVTTVIWTALDVNGNKTTGTQTVEITNNAPVISGLSVSPLIQLGSATLASATHSDNNLVSGTWNWGDGSSTSSVIAGTQLSGSHIYNQAGLYDVSLTVVDACGKTDTEDYSYVVIYNPCNGFITGGGFINSPSGSYASNLALSGKSNYGFNAKYVKGNLVPTGEFNFHINSADFKVKSTSLSWLMVSNNRAILKGMATVDGQAGYHFVASVIDGNISSKNGTDYLRLIVWNNAGNVVYDNQNGDLDNARASNAIGNGQIVIHKSKTGDCYNYEADEVDGNGNNESSEDGKVKIDLTPVQIEMTVYPNPVVESVVTISIVNFGNTQARVDLTSLTGQLVYSIPSMNFIGGNAKIDFKVANLKSGNYLLRVSEIGTSKVGVKQITVSIKK